MMEKHWEKYCTMSLVHFMAFPQTMNGEGPIIESICKIAEDPFFRGIEIGWIKDPGTRAEAKAILDASHIQVGFVAHSALLNQKLDLNSLNNKERRRAVDQLKICVDQAADLGAWRLSFLSGKDPGDADRPKALDALISSVKEACAYAGDKGISLTCEVFDRSIDKKCLIGPADYAASFARIMRQEFPDFGLLYDLSHMPLLYENVDALDVIKDVLVHAHIGNCVLDPEVPAYGDLHPRFGWPGGCNDVPELVEFIRALLHVGYLNENNQEKPWVGFEIKPQASGETAELVLAGAKRVWQQAWWLV